MFDYLASEAVSLTVAAALAVILAIWRWHQATVKARAARMEDAVVVFSLNATPPKEGVKFLTLLDTTPRKVWRNDSLVSDVLRRSAKSLVKQTPIVPISALASRRVVNVLSSHLAPAMLAPGATLTPHAIAVTREKVALTDQIRVQIWPVSQLEIFDDNAAQASKQATPEKHQPRVDTLCALRDAWIENRDTGADTGVVTILLPGANFM